jgi:hypothetical protein
MHARMVPGSPNSPSARPPTTAAARPSRLLRLSDVTLGLDPADPGDESEYADCGHARNPTNWPEDAQESRVSPHRAKSCYHIALKAQIANAEANSPGAIEVV